MGGYRGSSQGLLAGVGTTQAQLAEPPTVNSVARLGQNDVSPPDQRTPSRTLQAHANLVYYYMVEVGFVDSRTLRASESLRSLTLNVHRYVVSDFMQMCLVAKMYRSTAVAANYVK